MVVVRSAARLSVVDTPGITLAGAQEALPVSSPASVSGVSGARSDRSVTAPLRSSISGSDVFASSGSVYSAQGIRGVRWSAVVSTTVGCEDASVLEISLQVRDVMSLMPGETARQALRRD